MSSMCDMCRRRTDEVSVMIASDDGGVHICADCIVAAVVVLNKHLTKVSAKKELSDENIGDKK